MCTVCGCAKGETRIEGDAHDHAFAHSHEAHGHAGHEHLHRHADGTVHAHPHPDESGHAHGHDGGHAYGHMDAQPHSHGVDLDYGASPAAVHAPGIAQERMVRIEQDILAKNNAYAEANRRWFADHGVFAVNLVSSPGSGKTTLLVRTIQELKARHAIAVVEGDQQTSVDAERIRATGVPALQVNTGKGCHLDAHMVGQARARLRIADASLLLIENVGNLVCPADFDLGEAHKVVILSVTEGEDKPLKYPNMFRAADLMLLNKVDLLPHLSFDVDRCLEYARRINPDMRVIQASAIKGTGMDEWLGWLTAGLEAARIAQEQSVDQLRRRVAELEAQLGSRAR